MIFSTFYAIFICWKAKLTRVNGFDKNTFCATLCIVNKIIERKHFIDSSVYANISIKVIAMFIEFCIETRWEVSKEWFRKKSSLRLDWKMLLKNICKDWFFGTISFCTCNLFDHYICTFLNSYNIVQFATTYTGTGSNIKQHWKVDH